MTYPLLTGRSTRLGVVGVARTERDSGTVRGRTADLETLSTLLQRVHRRSGDGLKGREEGDDGDELGDRGHGVIGRVSRL